ncbi:MAG: radical SAM family heme chaperone HemW [Anaerolineales bacterium]
MQPRASIYIHVPFCKHRCAYCDFNTYAHQEALLPDYVNALTQEIRMVGARAASREIVTVFFGGGTPSLLSPVQFEFILRALRDSFHLLPDAEITIEANPGTVTLDGLKRLRELGINRISYGAQSANAEELRMLERAHSFFEVIQAVSDSRKAGFDNLNLDLMYGLPEQTLDSWKTTLTRIARLQPEHISAYALTLEHGTPFGRWSSKGLLPIPDPDLAAEMYEYAEAFLEAQGYAHYEISNWAKENIKRGTQNSTLMCKHNLQYWRSLPYYGFGAGAHGYVDGTRYSNALRIKTYIERVAGSELQVESYKFPLSPAAVNQHKQSAQDDISDYMINNLRLTEMGVSASDFQSRFGRALLDVFGKEIEELLRVGLLEKKTPEIYRLTKRGRLLGNQAFVKFV